MIQVHKNPFSVNKKMLDLLNENYSLLLFLQHFNIDFTVNNKTVKEICDYYQIDLNVFILIGNLYNGFYPEQKEIEKIKDITPILAFLKNSHSFYIHDKYPELTGYLKQLKKSQNRKDIILIDQFFHEYFDEVLDHLEYEDEIAFPYFYRLTGQPIEMPEKLYSSSEYRNHHTDIETKLTDLKNLLLKYIHIPNELSLKRKFLNALFGLEFDLKIHSMIEEMILIPVIENIESGIDG